jgi:hypothetical protein
MQQIRYCVSCNELKSDLQGGKINKKNEDESVPLFVGGPFFTFPECFITFTQISDHAGKSTTGRQAEA